MVREDTDIKLLRTLHLQKEGSYQLFIITSEFGSRGVDFRCKNLSATLLVMSQFTTDRDAYQCFNRVGRFGDAAKRCSLFGMEIISKDRNEVYELHLQVAIGKLDNAKKVREAREAKNRERAQLKRM